MVTYHDTDAAALEALGDPTRRAILERLLAGPRPVGEIARELPVSRPAVSQHLRVLTEAGLVSAERDGSRRLYRLDPRGIEATRRYLDRFWARALAAFKEVAESDETKGRTGGRKESS